MTPPDPFQADQNPDGAARPRIPKPPTPEERDQLSRDQALITDEWADSDAADGLTSSRTEP